ncbi:hypothetical protein STEG23_002762, partial [Scotinomys teguina]
MLCELMKQCGTLSQRYKDHITKDLMFTPALPFASALKPIEAPPICIDQLGTVRAIGIKQSQWFIDFSNGIVVMKLGPWTGFHRYRSTALVSYLLSIPEGFENHQIKLEYLGIWKIE